MPHKELARTNTPTALIIFGATGDLATRKLIPALLHLHKEKLLPSFFTVVGFSRRDLSDDEFRSHVRDVCKRHGDAITDEDIEKFVQLFVYRSGSFEERAGYDKLATLLGRQDEQWNTCANKLFYLAVPPQYYKTIFQNLADSGLTIPCGPDEGWTRVIVEKPFGKDLQTAQELDEMLGKLFKEEQIYRIDHYLGKDTVRNILAFRFSNTFLQPAWNNQSIESIHIKAFEKENLEERGGFYDGLGALRDVGQNHMLQMLALFTMENPGSFEADSIRQERLKILESLEIMGDQEVARQTKRGQYEGYLQTGGVNPESNTETYFHLRTHIASARWQGVPMYLESGKALAESKVEVTVNFRHHTPCLCPPESGKHYTNTLHYRIQPQEGIVTSFWVKRPGADMVIEEKDFSFDYHQAFQEEEFIDAYTKLLFDAIEGDQTLFVSTAEIVASWQFIDPIINGWNRNVTPLSLYKQGSQGPVKKEMGEAVPKKEMGFIGLGKMGQNMVARLLEHGGRVVAYDPNEEARKSAAEAGADVVDSIADVVASLRRPCPIWIMVPHQVVGGVLEELLPLLKEGDVIFEGGNSFYKDSVQRAHLAAKKGVEFLDVGVSGGPSGARSGACLMVGGDEKTYKEFIGLFQDLAVPGGYDYMGTSGAGHFVKMVHNGIEYGMMQAIAEGFTVMKDSKFELNLKRIAQLYNHGSVIQSSLIGWLKDAYAKYGEELADISGTVAHSGEGKWTIEAAQELGIPVPIIEASLQFRIDSEATPTYTGQVLSALRNMFGGHDVKKN